MGELLLGIDAGTTSCKAAVVTLDGREVAQAKTRTPWEAVETGAEMDPYALRDAVLSAVTEALKMAPPGPIVAVGVTSMGEAGVLLDDRGEPVAPTIAWFDVRGEQEAGRLTANLGPDVFSVRTGLPPGPYWSIAKYMWLRAHHRGSEDGRRWLSVAEWIVRCLGGDEAAELSLATRTGLLDVTSRTWWDGVREGAAIPSGLMPPIVQAGAPSGRAVCSPPRLRGAVLTVAGHDHLAAAVGTGATEIGDVLDSCGTAEAVVRGVRPPLGQETILEAVSRGLTVGWHVVPEQQTLVGFFQFGRAVHRFLRLLGIENLGARRALDEAAAAAPKRRAGLRVHGLAAEEATLRGIGSEVTSALVWRAVLEAAARETGGILSAIEDLGGPTRRLVMTGGWARSAAIRALKRDVLGAFDYPSVIEAGCRGAALLGGLAAGVYRGVQEFPRSDG